MRRKIKLAFIDNKTARKASFKKRRAGLMKKVKELTILCDVSACILIYGQREFDPAMVWPNEEEARRLIRRFKQVPEMEQCKKMVTQESYLRERNGKMTNQIQKLVRENKETVLARVMKQIGVGKPLEEIGTGELRGVMGMLEKKIWDVRRRNQYNIRQFRSRREGIAGISLPSPSTEEIAGQRELRPESMFGGARQAMLPDRIECHDFLAGFSSSGGNGFQDFGVRYGVGGARKDSIGGSEANNHGFTLFGKENNKSGNYSTPSGKELDLAYGYFGEGNGNSNKNKVDGLSKLEMIDEMDLEGNYNQEIGMGDSISLPITNYVSNIENIGFGIFQSDSGIRFGDNKDNSINHNGGDIVNMFDFFIAGYGAASHRVAKRDIGNVGGNNVNAGLEIEKIGSVFKAVLRKKWRMNKFRIG